MASRKPFPPGLQGEACRLQEWIRRRGTYRHIEVRPVGKNLVIEACEGAERRPVARLTVLGRALYGLSFCDHKGRWERMPCTGSMEAVASEMMATLGPYFERMEF